MFEAWLGFALDCTGKFTDAYQFLDHALKLGEEAGDKRLIGYASAWLTWTCADMGLLEEALVHGERAKEISGSFESDQYLYFKSVGALGYVYWHKGEAGKVLEIGKRILDYGQIHSNVRSMVMGYWTSALSYVISSKFQPAIECCQKAIQLSADPFYLMLAKFMLGACHTLSGDFQSAESQLQEAVAFSQQFGSLRIGTLAQIFLGAVRTGQGRLKEGVEMIREAQRSCVENGRRAYYAQSELILGRIYMGIAEGTGPKDWVTLGKNIGFLLRNAPFAGRKAADHLQKAIEVSAEIGANWTLATASLELGLLHKAKGRLGQARECISRAIEVFEQCGLLEQAKEAKEALAALL
jgi:tetratricopeptide (TPR) repeat protein